MKRIMFYIPVLLFLAACNGTSPVKKETTHFDHQWLDSVKKVSDSSWHKKYRSPDFFTADYYITLKDSIVTQVMNDSAGNVRQIIAAKYDQVRLFYAQYYANGQLMASLPLDSAGRYHGASKTFYENGRVKSEGNYTHGFYSGTWTTYDANGKKTGTETYDGNGQLVK